MLWLFYSSVVQEGEVVEMMSRSSICWSSIRRYCEIITQRIYYYYNRLIKLFRMPASIVYNCRSTIRKYTALGLAVEDESRQKEAFGEEEQTEYLYSTARESAWASDAALRHSQ